MATSNKFKIGDVVKLKSGGPDMTVRSAPDNPGQVYQCQWFAGKKLEQGAFREESLEMASNTP